MMIGGELGQEKNDISFLFYGANIVSYTQVIYGGLRRLANKQG